MISEKEIQISVIQAASYHPILKRFLISYPIGGSRHILEAKSLKKQGARAGVSDLFLAYPNKKYHGFWLELKKDKKCKLTPAQKEWIELMKSVGYAADVAYSYDEALHKLFVYINT
jgi:hypothetical protein